MILSAFTPFDDLSFDKAKWDTAHHDTRTRMTDDLIAKHLKTGAARIEVLQLLGKPDATPNDSELEDGNRKIRGHRVLDYNLGLLGDPMHIDEMHLLLYFGSDERLTGAYVVQY